MNTGEAKQNLYEAVPGVVVLRERVIVHDNHQSSGFRYMWDDPIGVMRNYARVESDFNNESDMRNNSVTHDRDYCNNRM